METQNGIGQEQSRSSGVNSTSDNLLGHYSNIMIFKNNFCYPQMSRTCAAVTSPARDDFDIGDVLTSLVRMTCTARCPTGTAGWYSFAEIVIYARRLA
jgi:hypothetical protein